MDLTDAGDPQTLILYSTPDAWRFSIYTDRMAFEGTLATFVTPDVAQHEAAQVAEGVFGRSLNIHWDVLDPGYWVAHISKPVA